MNSKLASRLLGVVSGLTVRLRPVAAGHRFGWARASAGQKYYYTGNPGNCLSPAAAALETVCDAPKLRPRIERPAAPPVLA